MDCLMPKTKSKRNQKLLNSYQTINYWQVLYWLIHNMAIS